MVADRHEAGAESVDQRAQIVEAAWLVLERSGYEGLKVQLVLRETGLSARAFYRHFSDKDALLLELMKDEYARSGARVRATLARADSAATRVTAWIDEVVQAAGDPRRAARARLFTAQPSVSRRFAEELAASARLMMEPLEDAVRDGRRSGELPLGDPERDARIVHMLAGSAMARALAEGSARSVDDISAEVADFALRALGYGHTSR